MAGGEVIKELLVALGVDADTGAALDFSAAIELAEIAMQAAAIAAAALAAAIIGAVAATVEAGSAATDGAARTGLSAEAYQELAYAAQQCGVPMELLEASLGKVTAMAGKAANGDKEAAKAFEALGISVTDANGKVKSSEQLFNETTAALAKIEDPAKRAAAAQALYGESAAKLMPLLSQGTEGIEAMRAEAELLGIVLSDEDVAAADAFGDSMDMLTGIVRGLAFDIGTALLPFLQRLVDGFKEWYLANRELIGKGLTVLSTILGGIFRIIGTVIGAINTIIESTIGWENLFTGIAVVVGILTAAVAGLAAVVYAALSPLIALSGVVFALSAVALAPLFAILTAIVGVFAAVGTAIASVVLVFEDFYTYLQGGDSLIGRFLDQWRESDGILGSVARLFDSLVNLGRVLWAPLGPIGDAGSAAFTKLLTALQPVYDFFAKMAAFLGTVFAPVLDTIISGINALTGGINAVAGGVAGVTGAIAPDSGGAAGAASSAFGSAGAGVGASAAVGAPVAPSAGGAGGGAPASATMANTYNISGAGTTAEQVMTMIRDFMDQDTRALTDLSAGAAA